MEKDIIEKVNRLISEGHRLYWVHPQTALNHTEKAYYSIDRIEIYSNGKIWFDETIRMDVDRSVYQHLLKNDIEDNHELILRTKEDVDKYIEN